MVGVMGPTSRTQSAPWLSPSGTPQNGTDVSHLGSPANTGAKYRVSLGVKRISGPWDSIVSLSARGLLLTGRQTPRPCGHHASDPWAEPAPEIRERVGGRDWERQEGSRQNTELPQGTTEEPEVWGATVASELISRWWLRLRETHLSVVAPASAC